MPIAKTVKNVVIAGIVITASIVYHVIDAMTAIIASIAIIAIIVTTVNTANKAMV